MKDAKTRKMGIENNAFREREKLKRLLEFFTVVINSFFSVPIMLQPLI